MLIALRYLCANWDPGPGQMCSAWGLRRQWAPPKAIGIPSEAVPAHEAPATPAHEAIRTNQCRANRE